MSEWVRFTKRTDGLKLDWLRKRLTDQGIAWRDAGHSFHAPIVEVIAARIEDAWKLLAQPMPEGVSIDDADDEDPRFALDRLGEAFPWDLPEEEG